MSADSPTASPQTDAAPDADRPQTVHVEMTINGAAYAIDAKPELALVWALRDLVGRDAVRIGCGRGQCGACTVWLNGKVVQSCQIRLKNADQAVITTPGYKAEPDPPRET